MRSLILALATVSSLLVAGEKSDAAVKEMLMISIDKKAGDLCEKALSGKLQEYRDFLIYRDPTMGNEYVNADLIQYIDYGAAPDAPYYGVAIIELEYTSPTKKEFYIDRLNQSGRYTLYSNPGIAP
jgi:hypothetical protein